MKEVEYLVILIMGIVLFFTIIMLGADIGDMQKKQERLKERVIVLETKIEMWSDAA